MLDGFVPEPGADVSPELDCFAIPQGLPRELDLVPQLVGDHAVDIGPRSGDGRGLVEIGDGGAPGGAGPLECLESLHEGVSAIDVYEPLDVCGGAGGLARRHTGRGVIERDVPYVV